MTKYMIGKVFSKTQKTYPKKKEKYSEIEYQLRNQEIRKRKNTEL